jgi:hypothetical protein
MRKWIGAAMAVATLSVPLPAIAEDLEGGASGWPLLGQDPQ